MKICVISHDFSPNIGGIAAHVAHLSASLAALGHEVSVATIRYGNASSFSSVEGGVRIFRFKVPKIGKLRGVVFIVKTFFFFLFSHFDVVHWHNMLPDTFVALPIHANRKVFTNHSSDFLERFDRQNKSSFWSFLFKGVDVIIGPSEELSSKAAIFFNKPKNTTHFIPNGVDVSFFRLAQEKERLEARHQLEFKKDAIIVLCPRRLEYKNGVDIFVEAAALIEKKDFIGIVAGNDADVAYAKQVKDRASALGLGDVMRFVGAVANEKMRLYYWASDVVVLPSRMEATSIAGLEAMACGLPLVGARVGGIPSIIFDKQSGLLVDVDDSVGFADALSRLCQNTVLRTHMGVIARQKAQNLFSWESITKKTLVLYE